MAPDLIPLTYAAAMGAAALAALGSGRLYDRIGLRGLIVALPLSAVVPVLSFSTSPTLVWAGAVIWGAAMGIHESTMRAAVADLVPAARRGTSYGIFTAAYGLTWLIGSTLIGFLYGRSVTAVILFVLATQAVALILFVPLAAPDHCSGTARRRPPGSSAAITGCCRQCHLHLRTGMALRAVPVLYRPSLNRWCSPPSARWSSASWSGLRALAHQGGGREIKASEMAVWWAGEPGKARPMSGGVRGEAKT